MAAIAEANDEHNKKVERGEDSPGGIPLIPPEMIPALLDRVPYVEKDHRVKWMHTEHAAWCDIVAHGLVERAALMKKDTLPKEGTS